MADEVVIVDTEFDPVAQVEFLAELFGVEERGQELLDDMEAARLEAADALGEDCAVSVATVYRGPTPAIWLGGQSPVPAGLVEIAALEESPHAVCKRGRGRRDGHH